MSETAPLPGGERRKKLPVGRLVGTLLSFALFFYLIASQGWDEFLEALKSVPPSAFWLGLVLMFGSRAAVTLRWFVLLRAAGLNMSLKDCTRLVFMGLFASNFLPTTVGGDLVRMAGALRLGLDAGASAASLVTDRLVGMAGMATFLPPGLGAVARGGGFAGMAVLPSLTGVREKAGRFGRSLWSSLVASAHNPAGLLWALLCTYAHMAFTFGTVWLVLRGLGQPLSLWEIGGLWSLSYFVTLLPVSINGLGLQELSITYLYTHFGGVPVHSGLALAVLLRLLFLLCSLPGAAFLPDILRPARARGEG